MGSGVSVIRTNPSIQVGGVGENDRAMVTSPLQSRFANDPEMREIVALFVAEAPDRLREVQAAAADGDWKRLRTLAHQIKGAAGGYGFPEISFAAGDLETAAGAAGATADSTRTSLATLTALLARVVMAG